MSKPEIPIDWKKADELMMAGCLGTEIAAFFGIHPETFYDRVTKQYGVGFSEYFAKIKGKGCSLLRAHQYAKALGLTDKGDNTLLIWLGKNRLDQRDNKDPLTVSNDVEKKMDDLNKSLRELREMSKAETKPEE